MIGAGSDNLGLVAAMAAAAVGAAGLLTMAATGDWAKRRAPYFSAFSVGYLSVVVLFHLFPEAASLGTKGALWVVIGFISLLGVSLALGFAAHGVAINRIHLAMGFVSVIALGTHSFFDGVLYESIFHDLPANQAIITVPGLLLHKFPEGVIAFFLLRDAGFSRWRSTLIAFFATAVTTPFGAWATQTSVGFLHGVGQGPLLGLSAGALAYIIVADLMPHAGQVPARGGYLYAGLGAAIATAAIVLRVATTPGGL